MGGRWHREEEARRDASGSRRAWGVTPMQCLRRGTVLVVGMRRKAYTHRHRRGYYKREGSGDGSVSSAIINVKAAAMVQFLPYAFPVTV